MAPLHCLPVLAAAVALLPATAEAGEFPVKPVRVVVPQPTGGATDIQARLFAAKLSQSLGQQFIIDNRSGGGAAGVIAFTTVARAAPAGYTLLAVVPSFTFSPALYRNYPIDPVKDFAPISLATRAPYLLVVNAASPVRTVRELVALAKARSGKLRAVAYTGSQRTPVSRQTPTLAETVAPGFELKNMYSLFAPAKTPKPVLALLNREVAAIVNAGEVAERLAADGAEPAAPVSVEEFRAVFLREVAMWEKLVRNLKVEM